MSDNLSRSTPSGNRNDPGQWGDLSTRLVSALVLVALSLALTWHSPLSFALLVAAGGVVLCWEWGRLVRGSDFDELTVLHAASVLIACGLAVYDEYQVALLVLLVGPSVKFALADDRTAANLGLSLAGVPYVGLPALALIWLRSDPQMGLMAILFLFVTVWSVDIFAYVFGRAIGGPKLAPSISPKKTWSGFLGGVSAGALAGSALALWIPGASPPVLGLIAIVIGIASQLGDLAESALKRRFGVKDASNIIPGHGGLLDRVDGLLLGAVVAAAIALALGGEPGRALLVWGAGQ